MSAFNICVVRPKNYVHSSAFLELAELLYHSLSELGHEVVLGENKVNRQSTNIIIGCHLLSPDFIAHMPASTIILNTEQIHSDDASWNRNIFEWADRFEIWDYSIRNIGKFAELGIGSVKHLKLGYQKELERIAKPGEPDIDVLFYGSLNERRSKIIQQLQERGLRVETLFGIYGAERDAYIGRSRLVLNHHFYKSHIFEVVRVFYLLTNRVAVVGEISATTSVEDMYAKAVCGVPYDGLVERCVQLIADPQVRRQVEADGYEEILRYPQRHFTAAVLA